MGKRESRLKFTEKELNSVMIHCGDPISYTNLNSNYWQTHFYTYGRLP